jgi:energy-coupling factor transporter ATP-binding protein EcfA2
MPNRPANVIAFGSLFNFAVAAAELPLIRTRAFERVERLVGYRSLSDLTLTERYVAHLEFAEQARQRFEAVGIEIRDMLDVQGLLWRQWLAESREEDPVPPVIEARVWWVCQGHTYGVSRDGGYLWAPRVDKAGQPKAYWDRLAEAETGDLVLHYSNGSIRAVGTVTAEAVASDRPSEFAESEHWKTEGLRLPVGYRELPMPIALSAIPAEWRTPEAGPFTSVSGVQQGYFYAVSDEFVGQMARRFPELELGDFGAVPGIEEGPAYVEPPFEAIRSAVAERGLRIDAQTLRRYHLSLKTRGFVVLSGQSGSGKTWLAELYAEVVGARALLVAVAPNWTTNEDLLGYLDPLSSRYRHTPFSQFLLEAADEHSRAAAEDRAARPFHLILDEMNLARVEYYFARFLSAMEVRARAGTATLALAADHQALLTPNLKFIGTVNVDETTHGFADKVYDRAQLIEVGVDEAAIREHLGTAPYAADLLAVWRTVLPVAPFAFRVVDEIASYFREADRIGAAASALDEQLLQKVLPKIKGTDLRCQTALEGMTALDADRFPLTQAKASAMLEGFRAHGFASFF